MRWSFLVIALVACGRGGGAPDTIAAPETRAAAPDAEPPAPAIVTVQLLAFNDFHGALEPPTGASGAIVTPEGPVPAGGVEYLATWIDTLRRKNPNTVVVAAGDNIGASPLLSAAFHDEPTIEALNAVGLQITSVGNHEFDEGVVELQRIQKGGCHPKEGCFGGDGYDGAKFEYLAANVIRKDDGTTLFPPYTIRSFGKARVAFIGLTLENTPAVVTARGVAGVTFKDEVETVNALVPKLVADGIHAIVVLLHEGGFVSGPYDRCEGITGPIFDLARAFDKEVDVVIGGHTNAAHVCDIDGKIVTSAAHLGRLVTAIDLSIDEATGHVVDKHAQNIIVRRDVAKAPALSALIERYDALVKQYADVVVATIPKDLVRELDGAGQSTLGSVIADAQLQAESDPSTGSAVVALMNPGGIRADVLAGEVTFGELFGVQPFTNNLVTMTLTGAQLEQALEEQWIADGKPRDKPRMLQISSSFTYRWDAAKAPGVRVDPESISIDGKPVAPDGKYRVVMNYFLAGGGDGFTPFAAGTDRTVGIINLDALVDYLKKHPGLEPPPSGRINRL